MFSLFHCFYVGQVVVGRAVRSMVCSGKTTLVVKVGRCSGTIGLAGTIGSTGSVTSTLRGLGFDFGLLVSSSVSAYSTAVRGFVSRLSGCSIKVFCFTKRKMRVSKGGCLLTGGAPVRGGTNMVHCSVGLRRVIAGFRRDEYGVGVFVVSTYESGPCPSAETFNAAGLTPVFTPGNAVVTCSASPKRQTGSKNLKGGDICAKTLLGRVGRPKLPVRRFFGEMESSMCALSGRRRAD